MCGYADLWILCTFMPIINTNYDGFYNNLYIYCMKLRIARHTTNLQPLIDFYTSIIGLQVIGEFKDHTNYEGVFIGGKNAAWHLEFTASDEPPNHTADEDDMLVFYASSVEEYNDIKEKIDTKQIEQAKPKNSYWEENGITIIDPDGFRVVIALSV